MYTVKFTAKWSYSEKFLSKFRYGDLDAHRSVTNFKELRYGGVNNTFVVLSSCIKNKVIRRPKQRHSEETVRY
ncbi:hypothetical protein EWB00_004861 [Schistosoma japonicum]|uniref:Uncharacterized protein n=1 Tax=Schistosoma japonicum TaxID=6182 RepID=A0A4Z2D3U3_SCHJA|nr:hypothetical protein EWB00_004861 [Schistosoma japonicum]